MPCVNGEYCPLGRSSFSFNRTELLCPIAHSCSTPFIMQPSKCTFEVDNVNYCPAGTITGLL